MITSAQRAFLDEIPSETTVAERDLLVNSFRDTWDGQGNVVEIGPFLGGTTRAIALGMLENPRRDSSARLYTFDRFDDYYSPAELRKTVNPLVLSGTMSDAQAEKLCAAGNFLGIFDAIHGPHAYYSLIRAYSSPLPDLPADIAASTSLDVLAGDQALGALFIDGCKSWASTHYAMKFLLPRTRPGARLIFQDYGWYTCFWISAFVYALHDLLEWHEHADATYVFSLKRPVTEQEVAQRFASTPDAMGRPFFKNACLFLLKQSVAQRDLRGGLIAQLHFVAALATLGQKSEGLQVLNSINPREYGSLAGMILGSHKSPTYRPGGDCILWTEA